MEETRFIVFTAGFNSEKWVKKNIESVRKQNYSNYIHVIVDDATNDNTAKLLQKYRHDKLKIYRNKNNKRWIYNAVNYLGDNIKSKEDVIVTVDLDDWLAHKNVLSNLNKIYIEEKVWMTYGSFSYIKYEGITPSNFKGYKEEDIIKRNFREIDWAFWHLRTFKAFLWNAINKDDLKGPDGNWAPYTYDKAICFPMMEMCQPNKIKYIKDIMYIYNKMNHYSSKIHKINSVNKIGGMGGWFRSLKKYDMLER